MSKKLIAKKLIKEIKESYTKGKVYNLADGDDLIPKLMYSNYFENTDEVSLTEGGEWMAEDKCKKSVTFVLRVYE